ncbi:MAG: hypothetical protein JNL30_00260 [Rubrivivax sp.]|nr:hypothetical protein [Rubrivivax sp.]
MSTQRAAPIDGSIPDLVAQVYEAAPQEEQRALLAMLIKPLGLLSLAAIGSGIFAHLRLKGGWPEFQPAVKDLERVRTSDMVALVHHVQQVSIETVQGLATYLKGSPVLAGSAAAAVLVTLLVQRARRRRGEPGERLDDAQARAPAPTGPQTR